MVVRHEGVTVAGRDVVAAAAVVAEPQFGKQSVKTGRPAMTEVAVALAMAVSEGVAKVPPTQQ